MATHREPAMRLAWIGAIRDPQLAMSWSLAEWERVVRLGRRLRLLARLAESLDAAGLLSETPPAPRRHLIAEQRISRHRTAAVAWAIERVGTALESSTAPLVLLKGAAYLAQYLPIASGRLPSDVDILVPRVHISKVQALLQVAGWSEVELDEHDRRYYHEYSHEVPPMVHAVHPLELDLHHGILPPTARIRVDSAQLLSRLQPSQWIGWHVLQPVDQVLHCAAHLFCDSDLRDRIRDLIDLDGLLRHFGTQPPFWDELTDRAQDLGLAEPLALGSHFCVSWLGTPIPDATQSMLLVAGPTTAQRRWLLPILECALLPAEPDHPVSRRQAAADWVVLARYHHRRMPLRLLVPHLLHRAGGPKRRVS